MIKQSRAIQGKVDALYAITESMGRGDTLTHQQVSKCIGFAPHVGSYDWIVGRVRRRLEQERGISTWPETTVGYKLCTEAEQLQIPLRRGKRAARQVSRGMRSVLALPDDGLSEFQRRAKAFIVAASVTSTEHYMANARAIRAQLRPDRTRD